MSFSEANLEMGRRFARSLPTYDRAADVQRFMAERLIRLLKDETGGKRHFERVLDLGCGTGLLFRRFRKDFDCAEAMLLDLVPECERFLRDEKDITFIVRDLDAPGNLPTADLILSGACIQWLRTPGELFRSVYRALPSGGLFAASAFRAGNLREIAQCGGSPLASPDDETWRSLLRDAGFRVQHYESGPHVLEFDSPRKVLEHLKKTGVMIPSLKGVPEIRSFLRKYERLCEPETGRVPLTYEPCFWIAEKE